MRVAFAIWNQRISPLLDSCQQAAVADFVAGEWLTETTLALGAGGPRAVAQQLQAEGVELLVCGAVSSDYASILREHGIRIFPFVCGDLADIMAGYAAGTLRQPCWRMPGCGHPARHRHGQRRALHPRGNCCRNGP